MKYLKQICATILLACMSISPAWAMQYCGTEITKSEGGQSQTYYLTCEKVGNEYVFVAELKDGRTFKSSDYGTVWSGILGGWTDIHTYFSLSNSNKTLTARFNVQPNFTANGANILKVDNGYGGSNAFTPPTDITWGTCGPKTLYFVNSWGWETPHVYLWKDGSSDNNGAFPGQTLIAAGATQISTTCTGAPVYQIDYDSKYDRVIFNNGSNTQQTSSLVICENRFYNPHPNGQYDADEWYYSNNFSLVGNFNSWNAATNPFSAWTSGSTVVSTTVHLAAGSYEFKIRQRDRTGDYGNNGTITGDVNCWFMSPNEGNCHLTVTIESDYTFTYDFAANRLSVAFPETVPPCMTSASLSSAGSNSAILDVAGTDGDRPAPTTFRVSTSSTFDTYTDYAAAGGQITVTGLAPCTGYTLYVAAVDANGNVSTDNETASCQYKSVTFTTTASTGNLAQGQACGGTLTGNEYEKPPRAFDGDKTATYSYTSYDQNGNPTTLWVDLGSLQEVNKVRIYWGTDFSNNYKIEYSEDGTDYTTAVTFTANPVYTDNCSNYQEHTFETVNARYVRLQTVSTNWVRIYEFEVYGTGNCPVIQEEPQMTSAAATDVRQEEADIHLASRDNKTTAAGMKYHVNVQSTSGYDTEWDLLLTGQASGNYTLKGLVPGTDYTVTVSCEDGDGNSSIHAINPADRQQKTFSFTTHNGDGCSWTSGESTVAVIGGPAWVALPEGMTYILKVSKHDNTHIAIEIDIYYDPATVSLGLCLLERYAGGILEAYLTTDRTYVTEFEDTSGHRHIKAVAGADLKDPSFAAFWGADGWNSDNNFAVKIEWGYVGSSGGGPSAAGYYIINPKRIVDGTDCKGTFVVTQKGRTPNITLPDGYDGTFDEQILYYRQFTPGQWEPLTIPFDVASVEVYDPDDNIMFTLAPNTYYLLREQAANVSGADFKSSWFDTSDPKPLKKKAYNIFFPKNNGWGAFYTKKYVLFRGTNGSQTVETSFSKGAAPTGDDQYTLYGNNTLSTTSLTAYFETSDGKYYEKETNRTLQPFECYVLANAATLARMPRIGPWRGENATTGIEDTWAETQMLQKVTVYNTFGQLLFTAQNTIYYDLMERCMTLPAGCYIIMSELGNKKIVIP